MNSNSIASLSNTKLVSLKKILKEMCVDICLITETWLNNANKTRETLEDFKSTTGYEFLRKDRNGGRGGGVAVCFNTNKIELTKAKIPPCKHEIYAAVGRRAGQRRKVVVLIAYVPPSYNAQQNKSFYKSMNDAMMTLKNKYNDPYVIIGGDFNRRSIYEATREYPDIRPISTGPTRGDATLDVLLTNFNDSLVDAGTTSSIFNETGVETDHKTVFTVHRMPRVPSYEIQNYSYYHIEGEGDKKFGCWLDNQDWMPVLTAETPSLKTQELHRLFDQGMSECYEWKTRNKKSSEPVWMTDWLRELIKDRRKVFSTDGGFRSARWKAMKNKIIRIVKNRKKKYNDYVLTRFESGDARDYFRNVRCLLGGKQ